MDKPPFKYDAAYRKRTYTPEHFEADQKRRAAATKRWREKFPEKDKASQRRKYVESRADRIAYALAYQKERPEKVREWNRTYRLRKKFNLERVDYEVLFKAQDGKCAICSRTQKKPLFVDHNHTTEAVRELLCTNCNSGLGHFRDDPLILHKALKYLCKHSN